MKKISALFLSSITFVFLSISFFSCKKINESTELGSGLIPPVDNITTFADTLNVETYNEFFTDTQDSTRVGKSANHYLGYISNDPFFGKTTASIFLELKPQIFPFAFASKENLSLDSVVLVLSYRDTYGDTTISQRVNVYEIDQSSEFKADTAYLIRNNNITYSNLIGSATFVPKDLNDSLHLYNEKASHQLRIKLDNSFGQLLLSKDSTNAYKSDSAFRKFFKGFAVVPETGMGNAVMGFQLSDTNTKLAIYYTYTKDNKKDTAVNYFRFINNQSVSPNNSANANLVKRDYTGTPVQAAVGGTTPDEVGYIQNTPGTYVRVRIPGLADLSNRIVHRAELIVQQLAHPSDDIFTPSPFLLLDAFDVSKSQYRAIPYDFLFDNRGQLNIEQFGMLSKNATGPNGETINVWRLNISRYIQNLVNQKEPIYELRLSSPYVTSLLYGTQTFSELQTFSLNPTSTKYRLRVGGGNHPVQPMKLRIVYSRL